MKKNRYINISNENNSSIGVIDMGEVDIATIDEQEVKGIVQPKLIAVMSEENNCHVKMSTIEVLSTQPIYIRASLLIESEGEGYYDRLTLRETWIY